MAQSRCLILAAMLAALICAGKVALADPLAHVEAKRVCMVNDTVFPKDQIPVQVEGKTYFGCCEMCKGKLASDASVRSAADPVSGKSVDKATAVIGATPDGRVLYFESEKTFDEYSKRS
jgi:YHS domain-containing protein